MFIYKGFAMKIIFCFILSFASLVFAQETSYNPNTPNEKIGKPANDKQTEATVSTPNSAQRGVESAIVGGSSDTCPHCAQPTNITENTPVELNGSSDTAGKSDGGSNTNDGSGQQ